MSVNDLNYEDVDFAKTGLKVVVCQARYEPLLRISHNPPMDFQEAIRPTFPRLEARKEEATFELKVSKGRIEPELSFPTELPSTDAKVWNFYTDDRTWTVSLSGKSFSLETSAYTNFREFSDRFGMVFQAFRTAYPNIGHFTRLGLRFVNVFEHEEFGGESWLARFNPSLMGVAADIEIGPNITSSVGQFSMQEDEWTITVRHGNDEGANYRLDLDHSVSGKVLTSEVPDLIASFNRRLYNIFRWAIREEMYDEMGPRPRN